jgi:hypothetical protein
MITYREQIAKEQLMDEIVFVKQQANNVIKGDVNCLAAMFKVACEIQDDVDMKDEISNVDYCFDELMNALDDMVTRCDDICEGDIFAGFEYGKLG